MENSIQVIGISQLFFVADFFLIGLPILYFLAQKRKLKRKLDLRDLKGLKKEFFLEPKKPSWIAVQSALLLAALLALSFALQFVLPWIGINDLGKASSAFEAIKAVPLMAIYLLTVRVIAEEVFFRAFLVPKVGFVVSSILFGLAHYGYGSVAQIIAATLLGLVLSCWFAKNKSLLPNIAGHMLFNAVNLLLLA